METVRRPGRVQTIAYDDTPLTSPALDVDARIGWLLSMSRFHHPDASMADGGTFHRALRDAGHDVSRSLVSRWESGAIAVTYDGLRAYEQVLGLEPDRVFSLAANLRAIAPERLSRVIRPPLDPSAPGFADRLDELIEVAEDQVATSADWRDLAWHIAAVPHVHLRAPSWEALAHQVVSGVARAVRAPYRNYAAAASTLCTVPRAQGFLADAVQEYVASPGVKVITNPVGLLARLPTRRAAQLTLGLLEEPPTREAYRPVVWAATQKVRCCAFTEEETARLDMLLLERWRRDPVWASDVLAELVASLPEGWRAAFTTAATNAGRGGLSHAVETGEDFPAAVSLTVAQTLADDARRNVAQRGPYGEDSMFVRLVREALCHRDTGRRHVAALVLAASPFAGVLCDEVLTMLTSEGYPPLLRARAATLVRYLADDGHRLRVMRHVDDRGDDVAAYLLQALGNMTFSPMADQAVRTSLRDEEDLRQRARVYALGMTGSPALESIAGSARAPAWQRSAARWWLAEGPALRT